MDTLARLFVMWAGGLFAMLSAPDIFALVINVWLLWSALAAIFVNIMRGA